MNRILRASIVLPVTSAPITEGALVLNGPLIDAVGTFNDIRQRFPLLAVEDLGDVILMPGLVNSHTHLELTRLRGMMPDGLDFVSWLLELVRQKRRLGEDDLVASAQQGIRETVACGVTAVGDIVTSCRVMQAVLQGPLAGVAFLEIIGDGMARELPDDNFGSMKAGISPHSTYTVSAATFKRVASSAKAAQTPLAIHVAESPEETVFLKDSSGPIAKEIYPLARWPLPEPSGLSPVAFLESTGILDEKPLLIHGVQVDEEDVSTIARHGLSVVHCPGSNQRLGVGRFPMELYRRFGVNVALGTDSAIGAKKLDMFEEMREAKRLHGKMLSCEDAVRMASINGAKALGLNTGALETGRRADLVTLTLRPGKGGDIYHVLLDEGGPDAVRDVIIGGKSVSPPA